MLIHLCKTYSANFLKTGFVRAIVGALALNQGLQTTTSKSQDSVEGMIFLTLFISNADHPNLFHQFKKLLKKIHVRNQFPRF